MEFMKEAANEALFKEEKTRVQYVWRLYKNITVSEFVFEK